MTDGNARGGQAEAWWAERELPYRRRPEVRQEIERVRAEVRRELEQEEARLRRLEDLADAGVPGAERALTKAYTWQAVQTDPPEPSAKDDPQEWSAFFRHEYGHDMPLNAAYEAEKHRIEAAAPADVGGMAAEYFEVNYPRGYDCADLAAQWRDGMSFFLSTGCPLGEIEVLRRQKRNITNVTVFASTITRTILGGDGLPRWTPSSENEKQAERLATHAPGHRRAPAPWARAGAFGLPV